MKRATMQLYDLYEQPGHLIRRAQQIAVAIFADCLRDHDITPAQYEILLAIRTQPGIQAVRLSNLVGFDRSTLATTLERLVRRGLVSRHGDTADRRVKSLYLAPDGSALLRDTADAFARAQDELLRPLSRSERWQFLRLLEQLVTLNNARSRAPLAGPDIPRPQGPR